MTGRWDCALSKLAKKRCKRNGIGFRFTLEYSCFRILALATQAQSLARSRALNQESPVIGKISAAASLLKFGRETCAAIKNALRRRSHASHTWQGRFRSLTSELGSLRSSYSNKVPCNRAVYQFLKTRYVSLVKKCREGLSLQIWIVLVLG